MERELKERFSRKKAQKAQENEILLVPQYVRAAHFREDFATDGRDGTD
jgi:hypothetical protein